MKRIFLITQYPLFREGLESLFSHEPDVVIVGRETDLARAFQQIQGLQPDVVILANGEADCGAMADVIRILQDRIGTRVIGLNLSDNMACIVQGEQRLITEASDLVEVVTGLAASAKPADSVIVHSAHDRRPNPNQPDPNS